MPVRIGVGQVEFDGVSLGADECLFLCTGDENPTRLDRAVPRIVIKTLALAGRAFLAMADIELILSSACPMSRVAPLLQQGLQIAVRKSGQRERVVLHGGGHELALGGLKLQDALLHGAARDESAGGDDAGLADAVGAVDGLGFDGGIPPGFDEDNVVGGGEVQAVAAGLEADEEDAPRGIGLERGHLSGAVARGAVEVAEGDIFRFKPASDEFQHTGELAEDDDFVGAAEGVVHDVGQGGPFAAGGLSNTTFQSHVVGGGEAAGSAAVLGGEVG